jgi:hypothetical protein
VKATVDDCKSIFSSLTKIDFLAILVSQYGEIVQNDSPVGLTKLVKKKLERGQYSPTIVSTVHSQNQ